MNKDTGGKIKLGQIWKNKRDSTLVEVNGRKGDGWRIIILTSKKGVYAGRHTLNARTLYKFYELI